MLYAAWHGAMPTTAPLAKGALVAATTKTVIQLKANATASFKVKSWGVSFDGITAAVPVQCELIETGTVNATVTAYVAADIYPYENAAGEQWIGQLGTAASGYNASVEGTITATRIGDYQLVAPTNQYLYDWVLSNEFQVSAAKVLRVRLTAPVAVNYTAFVKIEQ